MHKYTLLILLFLLSIAIISGCTQTRVNEYEEKYNALLVEYNQLKEDFKQYKVYDVNNHAFCGDNSCSGYYIQLENSENCPQDCSCGDGICDEVEDASQTCAEDCTR